MIVKCMKCDKIKELTKEELEEVGKFVEIRKLRAVGFLKNLSMDLRDPCKDEKEHQYEFTPEFDKEVHMVAKNCNDAEKGTLDAEKEMNDCELKIAELIGKKEAALEKRNQQKLLFEKGKEILKEIAFIPDPKLWS